MAPSFQQTGQEWTGTTARGADWEPAAAPAVPAGAPAEQWGGGNDSWS